MQANQPEFIHLRVHSSYSLLEGAITPKDITDLCKKHKMPAVAVTDSGNLFSSLEFSLACSDAGVQPIIGCIVSVNMFPNKKNYNTAPQLDKIILLAKNETGYTNLLKLVSQSFFDTEGLVPPHVNINDLKKLGEGLIVLTGWVNGPIGRLLLEKQNKEAENVLLTLKDIFADRLYMEIMRHNIARESEIEEAYLDLAYQHEIPIVATNDVFFASREIYEAHDALLCIAGGRYVSETDRPKATPEHYFKSPREMKALFADLPEAIENTVVIAKRCAVMSKKRPPMLPNFTNDGSDEADELRNVAEAGLKFRLENNVYTAALSEEEKQKIAAPYIERLKYELGVITEMKFSGYFLIVSDFMRWSKRSGIPVGPGRGSGAGSVVAWSLEITDLDPLRFGLLFERFLNPERISMPDFDIDFCQERREEVIRYVQQKYGVEKVAQIITFGKLQARAVIRDVGRVLQMSYGQVDRITKMIPFNPIDPVTLSKAISMDKVLQEMRDNDPEIAKLLDISLKLEGLNRHASTHAAGVVIGDRPLDEMVPVYRDPRSDMPVCGYSMKYAESAGLVKFDFLGLKTLTVIDKACQLIRKKGIEIDISKIPLDDKKSFEMLSKGDSIGVFQIESAGMRDTLRKLRPDNIEDIIALISLYRPGPMDNIPAYIARKHGLEDPDYLHPMLEGILKETYGVIIYQEQVMQIAQVMGGYSLGGADLLRRAMGKKIASEMDAQRKIFVDGAIKNNVDKSKASSIFDLVAKFAGYGFNKSHAAAYAMISYQTAYLKAQHPVEFLCASMNLEINDTDKLNTFRQDAVAQGIVVLPPDINKSSAYFTPEQTEDGLTIRYALGALKNVGVAAMEAMEKVRNEGGKFKDIFDFSSRLTNTVINKRQLESLTKSGSFDCISQNRKQVFDSIEILTRYSISMNAERNSTQSSLFGGNSSIEIPKPKLPETEDWPHLERMNNEFDAVGLYLGTHPISSYEKALKKLKAKSFLELNETLSEGTSYTKIAGVVISKRIRSSPRGRFANISLSDPTGIFEVSIFDEDLLSESRDLLESGKILIIGAEVRKDDGGLRMVADSISELDDTVSKQNLSFRIYLDNLQILPDLQKSLGQAGTGKSSVAIIAQADSQAVEIKLPEKYPLSLSSIADIKLLAGVREVEEV